MASLPGVSAAALVSHPPLAGEAQIQSATAENDTRTLAEAPVANFRFVAPTYFRTLGIPLRRGRLFDERDRGRCTAVLNERAVAAIWPGQDRDWPPIPSGRHRHAALRGHRRLGRHT